MLFIYINFAYCFEVGKAYFLETDDTIRKRVNIEKVGNEYEVRATEENVLNEKRLNSDKITMHDRFIFLEPKTAPKTTVIKKYRIQFGDVCLAKKDMFSNTLVAIDCDRPFNVWSVINDGINKYEIRNNLECLLVKDMDTKLNGNRMSVESCKSKFNKRFIITEAPEIAPKEVVQEVPIEKVDLIEPIQDVPIYDVPKIKEQKNEDLSSPPITPEIKNQEILPEFETNNDLNILEDPIIDSMDSNKIDDFDDTNQTKRELECDKIQEENIHIRTAIELRKLNKRIKILENKL